MTVMVAVAGVAPALEVIDSRYENVRFSVTDVVADNTSAAAIVIGPWSSPSTDVANLWHAAGNRRGTSPDWIDRRHSGSSDLCVGRRSAAGAYAGEQLSPGDIVMASAAPAAEGISANQFIRLSVEKLGSVSFAMGD